MKSKRWISLTLAISLLSASFWVSPTTKTEAAVKDTSYYTVEYADAVSGKALSYTGEYNDDWFYASGEDGRIAKLSMAYSAQVYTSAGQMAQALSLIGFSVVENVNYDRLATEGDCDFVTYTVAKKEIGDDTLYGVFIRGTAGDMQWQSNFNIGTDNVHRGFDTAAQEVFYHLEELIGSENKEHNLLWVTGHSRGGAVGNLLGGYVNEHASFVTPEHTLVYNFAVPATTKEPVGYPNIFNYNYSGDIITALPLETWGFSRHGQTLNYSPELKEEADALFEENTGLPFGGADSTTDFTTILNKWCPTQDDYYKTQFTYSPVNLITKYVVPLLMGTGSYQVSDFLPTSLENLNLYIYVGIHPEMIDLLTFFLNNKQAIVHGHAPVTYLTYTTLTYPHVHEFDEYTYNGDATCLEDGTQTAFCFDGASNTITAEGTALGHTYAYYRTDTVTGEVIHKCIRCDESFVESKDLTYAVVTVEEGDYEYLSAPITPSFTVKLNGELLRDGMDYTATYVDNNGVGTATVKVEGIGFYVGKTSGTFKIRQHEHDFKYVYQNDSTCLTDGTEKAVCYCGEEDVRTKAETALGHDYTLVTDEEFYEVHSCVRGDDSYSFKKLSMGEVKVDERVLLEKKDASCITVYWQGQLLSKADYAVTAQIEESETTVTITYKVVGVRGERDGFVGTMEGEVAADYPPPPYDWMPILSASGAGAFGVIAIVLGVFIGKKRRF